MRGYLVSCAKICRYVIYQVEHFDTEMLIHNLQKLSSEMVVFISETKPCYCAKASGLKRDSEKIHYR